MASKIIPHTTLGKNGPRIPTLGFGLMGLSHNTYGKVPDDEERFAILDRAYELGNVFWDSADLYGDSEALLGKWFKRTGKRSEIFLASKFGFVKGGGYTIDSSYEYTKKACDESLRLLGTDYIDLYYMHHANPETPIEQTMRALKELQAEGKIKHIGLSAISSAALIRAVKIAPVAAVQSDYSPFVRDIEFPNGTDLLKTCRSLGVTLVAAMPLNRGVLTSTFASGSPMGDPSDMRATVFPRFQAENRDANMAIVKKWDEMAKKKGCTAAQLSLAWLLKQGSDVVPIPGTKRMEYMEENWGAKDVVLSDEEEKEIRAFLEGSEVKGGALPKGFEHMVFTTTVEES